MRLLETGGSQGEVHAGLCVNRLSRGWTSPLLHSTVLRRSEFNEKC